MQQIQTSNTFKAKLTTQKIIVTLNGAYLYRPYAYDVIICFPYLFLVPFLCIMYICIAFCIILYLYCLLFGQINKNNNNNNLIAPSLGGHRVTRKCICQRCTQKITSVYKAMALSPNTAAR